VTMGTGSVVDILWMIFLKYLSSLAVKLL